MAVAVPCHACGYDLRAQPVDGVCPECAALVAESRRIAAIPLRPAWRDSDPRWRRRMLLGIWSLVLLIFLQNSSAWTKLPAPDPFGVQFAADSLGDTYFYQTYHWLLFCVGIVLLFAKERGRRHNRLDWTRRWGVISSYLVLFFGSIAITFLLGLVLSGIGAVFLSIPLRYQPTSTDFFARIGTAIIHRLPHPTPLADASLAGGSALVMLLACSPIYDALRSSGSRRLALCFLTPLALASVVQIIHAGRYFMSPNSAGADGVWLYEFYFARDLLNEGFTKLWQNPSSWYYIGYAFINELAKSLALLAIAIWLSVAQITAWRRRAAL